MWKIKLDDNLWLADGAGDSATTTNEADARLFPDIPSVKAQLKKVRKFVPYKEAMVVYDDGQQD